MKQITLICVLLAAVLIPSSNMQENETVDAATSCRPPTCFYMGGVHVPSYKKGWYISYGRCMFSTNYYSATGYLQVENFDYYYGTGTPSAIVYIGNNYRGKSVRVVTFRTTYEYDYNTNQHLYNTCRIFRYIGP